MMVSSLFLPAACRCVLSPLYPVPTHLKRGICIVFSANNIQVYSSIFTVFPSSPQVFPRESGPFPRRKSPSVGHLAPEAVYFPAAAGLVKAAGPSRPTARVLGGRRPAPARQRRKGCAAPPPAFCKKAPPAGAQRKFTLALWLFRQTKRPPQAGRPLLVFTSFLAAPGGRPRSGRG